MENNKKRKTIVNVTIIVLVIISIIGTITLLIGTGKLKFISDFQGTISALSLKPSIKGNIKQNNISFIVHIHVFVLQYLLIICHFSSFAIRAEV